MLLRASEESEERTLTLIGAVVVLCAVIAGFIIVSSPFGSRAGNRMSVLIDTPYVGQGVTKGTAMVIHGVKVGEVTNVAYLPGGGVRLSSDLHKEPVADLTDTMTIDFRPINYFGVTGINIIAGPGGQAIRDGTHIQTVPLGNFALQALLSRLGEVSAGALTPRLISVIDRAVRYTDALNPLVETMLIALDAVADTQTVPTAQLLANATGVSVAFPSFVDAVGHAGNRFLDGGFGKLSEADFHGHQYRFSELGSTDLFGSFGRLETKYVDDLLPAVDAVKLLTDPVPALLRPDEFGQTLVELRTRFEKMFAGTPEQRALQVRIVLDSLPGVAGPLGVMGGPQ